MYSHFLGKTNGLITLGAEPHEAEGLGIETANIAVDDRLPDDSEGSFGSEKLFVTELLDHFHDVLDGQTGVPDVG